MITKKFNNKEYSIPQSWDEVTVGMLIKSSELSELLEDAPLIAVLSAYTGIPVKELKLSNSTEVHEIMSLMEFVVKPYEPKMTNSFTLDGIVYSCEEELVSQRFEDWVSVQTALYNYREEPARVLPRLLAILCKKKKTPTYNETTTKLFNKIPIAVSKEKIGGSDEMETLSDFDVNERSKLFESLPMTSAKDIECFFLHNLNAYKAAMFLSSTTDIQKELVLHKLEELQNTLKQHKGRSGIYFGTALQITVLRIYLWWVKKVLVKYFNLQSINNSKPTWIQTFRKLLGKMLKRNKNGNNNS